MRIYEINRKTKETDIKLKINIDGTGKYNINTGIPFLDHLLSSFSKHGCFDLDLEVNGDLIIDDHHTVEDIGICLGKAIDKIEKKNINRYGYAIIPMDEARAMVSIDLGGRAFVVGNYTPNRDNVGNLSTENIIHFFESIANNGNINIHFEVIGGNEHHKLEVLFKSFGIALDMATKIDKRKGIISTKGVI